MTEYSHIEDKDIEKMGVAPKAYCIDDPKWAAYYPWWGDEWTDWETIMPRGGFIEDFVLSTKGTESSTAFAIWTALTTLSSALARDSYLSLFPASWYPNLYVILVGPPGVVKKSTVLNLGANLLRNFHFHLKDENLAWKKKVIIHTNRVTPEGLQDLLRPEFPKKVSLQDGSTGIVDRGSALTLMVSELSTFLGRQSYNVGMVSKLTDLYDCKEYDEDYTKKDGRQALRNIYVNFLAATTPSDLDSVIPEEAFGGGLMSRTIVVFEKEATRMHPLPVKIKDGPTKEDLEYRLAWLATNAFGPYTFTKEALGWYYKWYVKFKQTLNKKDSLRLLSFSRMDILLIKLAILIRAQRYQEGREVGIEDLHKAEQLLNKTYYYNESAVENVGASERGKYFKKLLEYIKKNETVNRRKLLTTFSRYLSSEELTNMLTQMKEMSVIDIYLDGHPRSEPSRSGEEEYIWKEGNAYEYEQ